MKYSEEEIMLLSKLWPIATAKELKEAFPNRSRVALLQKATDLGLGVAYNRRRKGDLTPLIDQSLISFYWLGFILADGHITKSGQLVVTIMDKDLDHLEKLALLLRASVKRPYHKTSIVPKLTKSLVISSGQDLKRIIRVAVQDPTVTDKIKTLLGLTSSNKTYNPPTVEALNSLNDEQLQALWIGFLDGDGRPGGVEIHSSWLDVLEFFKDKGIINSIRLKKYVSCYILVEKQKELYQFAVDNKLPILKRKWHFRESSELLK